MALAVAALSACRGGDPTATDPEDVFADGFSSPLEQVVIEAEGGTMVQGYDAWLKLLPRRAPVARFASEYEYIDCDAPRAFFARVLGSDELSPQHALLECQGYTDPRFDFDNGRWLISDRASGRLYFRVWKHYGPGR